MRETVRFEVKCKRIDPAEDGMLWRSIMVVPLIVTDAFGTSLIMGPSEAASQIQEVIQEAIRMYPKLGIATWLYLVTPSDRPNKWLLQQLELDPEFRLYPISWDNASLDVHAAFRAVDELRRGDACEPIA